jgi:hypothetical protein
MLCEGRNLHLLVHDNKKATAELERNVHTEEVAAERPRLLLSSRPLIKIRLLLLLDDTYIYPLCFLVGEYDIHGGEDHGHGRRRQPVDTDGLGRNASKQC